ncbi:MAG: hypothetical protein K2Y37_09495 [Pirellulales bacterium]|nr:hypothetical protein [Pirellulales bacterium]
MRCLPPRRWLQFRLSTWFVLVAILAWAMATRPYLVAVQGASAGPMAGPPWEPIYVVEHRVNKQLRWPALTLSAFLAWKAAWAAIERRRREALPGRPSY